MKAQGNYVEYMGVIIWRSTEPGAYVRYSALRVGAADTLEGMKALIRAAKEAGTL